MGLFQYLDWDSKFFGFNIGRINMDKNHLHPNFLDKSISEARARNIRCLYLEIPFGIPEVLDYCSRNRFSMVDFKTTLSKSLSNKEGKLGLCSKNITYEIKDEYYPFLVKIAEKISMQSRYAYDLNFGKKRSRHLYIEWLRKSFYEQFCYDFIIYIKDHKPIGFITLRIKNDIPFIDLLGISEDHWRNGIGKTLIVSAERRLLNAGLEKIKVITQGHNIGALRLYQSQKFKIDSVNVFYHIWID